MKKLLIGFALITLNFSCAVNNHKSYEYIKDQQILIYEDLAPDFIKTKNDFKRFKSVLMKKIKPFYTDKEYLIIKKALYSKRESFNITPVFQNFHGEWQGEWIEYKKSSIVKKVKYFHIWYPPKKINGISIQKVSIYSGTQNNRGDEIVAVNSSFNGKIYGGVDEHDKRTKASHIGFYIDEFSLIWIAKFDSSNMPYYSFYYERVLINKSPNEYQIKGIGFNYDRKNNMLKNIHKKKGFYKKL